MNKIKANFFIFLFFCLIFSNSMAGPDDSTYQRIKPAIATQDKSKIVVTEIFWYGCPHCYSFEPYINDWLKTKPEDVIFERVPGVLNPGWIPHAKAFYTAEKLGVLEKIHMPLFEALHREKKQIFTEQDLKKFFISLGVDGDAFTKTFNSQEVEIKIKKAYLMARKAKLTGVPAVVVNGKYMTMGSMAGSYDGLINVINELSAMERDNQ